MATIARDNRVAGASSWDASRAAEATQDAPVVSIEDLHKSFGRSDGSSVQAIAGISLDVRAGEMVVLVGPSGCGKTTLLRCVAGLELPSSGSIAVHGRTVYSSRSRIMVPPERRGIGMMFQSYALWPHMTVAENVAYPLRMRGVPRRERLAEATRLLDVTGLAHLAREHPTQLSGGQQQRVALARSLAASPRLVLFDEPLSNVDAKVRDELRVELKRMQSALGFAGLYVTHDQDEAMQIGSRLVVLKDGHVEQVGRPEDVYRAPETRYVGEFVGAGTVLPGVVSESGPDGATVITDAGPLRVKTSAAQGSHVVAVVRPHHVTLSAHPLADEAVASLAGRVVARLFMGTVIEYFVEVAGARIRVWAPEAVDLQEGDDAWVTIRQAQLVPQSDGGR